MAELRIPIISEFKGQKAFNQASKSTGALEKGVKKLGGAMLAAFSVQKIVQFGKAAAKAFIEDEKAASRLAQSVKNLGLAFETPRIEEFIGKLAMASGVTDDQLRPAMQKLLQTTGSVTKSQELLTQALDISRGSGVDYETVVNDLSMAYVGQTRGLRKYSLGLTQAELKTMSFAQIQAKLNKSFTGANAAYLETYAGKMGILSNAAGEATENIGKGLMDSLSILAGEGESIQPLADAMLEFSTEIANAITGIAVLIQKIKSIPGLDFLSRNMGTITDLLPNTGIIKSAFKYLSDLGSDSKPLTGRASEHAGRPGFVDPNAAARKNAEAAAAKRAKELANTQKKTLDTQKKQNALAKAAKTLDLERIGMTAALRGKISETDRLSLNLQLALLDDNQAKATKLSAELSEAVKRQNDLNAALRNTPEAPNPYRNWVLPADILATTAASLGISKLTETTRVAPSATYSDAENELLSAFQSYQQVNAAALNIEVYLDGVAVGGAVRDASVNDSLSGSFNSVNRAGRFSNVIK
jgi:hypothetical protein